MEDELFWADQIAKQIISRKKFHYTDDKILKFKEFTVKTSASLSGVLHIGRLSDTIRGETVYRALKDAGVKARLIWVAENMDPLRKIPKGVPKSYEKYLGMAVTDIPDPDKCHNSYAEHHMAEYFKVIDEFVSTDMKKYSMRDEYKKGSFNPYIKKILSKTEEIMEIQNKFRTNPLPSGWSPWTPICENCGKIVTPKVTDFDGKKVLYRCEDYKFETTTAKGCGHEGENDPLKGNGKMMWKSEWASQWAHFKVVSEGAGKEYQVPNSAFWINGEIVERVLDFPMPVPIFYEHIMIDNQKMSASLGNVVYPRDWLEVASPELLRLFYNKRLMKTRSFSWKDLPKNYDEYENFANVYLGKVKVENRKEEKHMKRLFEVSHGKKVEEPIEISFSHAAIISQIFEDEDSVVKSLKKTGHYNQKHHKQIFERLGKAKIWLKKYAPENMKFEVQSKVPEGIELDEKQKKALKELINILGKKDYTDVELHNEFYFICKNNDLQPKEFFQAAYRVLLNRDRGPKLANFILTLGKEKVVGLLKGIE
jgi:lysyl-tRNA synthetase class 1